MMCPACSVRWDERAVRCPASKESFQKKSGQRPRLVPHPGRHRWRAARRATCVPRAIGASPPCLALPRPPRCHYHAALATACACCRLRLRSSRVGGRSRGGGAAAALRVVFSELTSPHNGQFFDPTVRSDVGCASAA
eukprot:scaffold70242_cov66-Phaeocystis_antarctica.AAC.2